MHNYPCALRLQFFCLMDLVLDNRFKRVSIITKILGIWTVQLKYLTLAAIALTHIVHTNVGGLYAYLCNVVEKCSLVLSFLVYMVMWQIYKL